MNQDDQLKKIQKNAKFSLFFYIFGFVISITISIVSAYFSTSQHYGRWSAFGIQVGFGVLIFYIIMRRYAVLLNPHYHNLALAKRVCIRIIYLALFIVAIDIISIAEQIFVTHGAIIDGFTFKKAFESIYIYGMIISLLSRLIAAIFGYFIIKDINHFDNFIQIQSSETPGRIDNTNEYTKTFSPNINPYSPDKKGSGHFYEDSDE